jgi:general secretion pathway protein D
VKRIPALLLAGLLSLGSAHAQTVSPPATDGQAAAQAKSGGDFITLNFTNIDISALVKVMSEFTRRNFILDEKVTGKVTLMTPTKISPDEAYQVFLSALELKGFTTVEDGKIIRIVPTAAAKQSGLKVIEDGKSMEGEGYVTKLIRLTYVNPEEVVRTLGPLITRDGSLIAYPATNALIVTDSVPAIRRIDTLVQAMDTPTEPGKGKINVYYLKHADAEEIAKVMQSLVSHLPAHQPGRPGAAAGPATILEGSVTITADKQTNSLIIVGSPIDYETVKNVIEKLDIRRRQVYVEAAIIEMGLSKSRELGFEFQSANLSDLENSNKTSLVGGTNFPSSSGAGIVSATVQGPAAFASFSGLAVGAVKGTFKYNGTEFLSIGALLRALQSDSDVNVLSTPNILTTDNQKAEIMVGQNVPIVAGQIQSATTGGNIQTQINRQDVGIKLEITPQITADDDVRLEIKQEISDITTTPGLNPNLVGPTTSKRSAQTTVVIRDKQTMVIGGLIRDNVTSSESKVPFLGDIPLLGWLFKYKTTSVEKVNLMIFITPYIIKNEDDAQGLLQRKSDALEQFRSENRIQKKNMGVLGSAPTGTAGATAPSAAAPTAEMTTVPSTTAPVPAAEMRTVPSATAPVISPEMTTSPSATIPAPEAEMTTVPSTTAPVTSPEMTTSPSATTPGPAEKMTTVPSATTPSEAPR